MVINLINNPLLIIEFRDDSAIHFLKLMIQILSVWKRYVIRYIFLPGNF